MARPRIYDALTEKVKSLRASGMTIRAIVRELNIPRATVARMCKR